jgi:hypothetical protein
MLILSEASPVRELIPFFDSILNPGRFVNDSTIGSKNLVLLLINKSYFEHLSLVLGLLCPKKILG